MPRAEYPKMNHELAKRCRDLVFRKAEKYGIPPVYITAHIRRADVDKARFEVWRSMIGHLGMSRQMVATIFGRDRRRLRDSVLWRGRRRSRRRILVKANPPAPMPFQPVGNQLVWSFAVPLVLERPVMQMVRPFMKEVPQEVRERLDHEHRIDLARFYERQAKMLRRSLAGV